MQTDIENFQAALQTVQPTEAFLPTVSPGTLAQNVINEYYKDDRLPVGGRRGDARGIFTPSSRPDSFSRSTRPIWPWLARFPDKTLAEFRTIMTRRVEALNHALAGIRQSASGTTFVGGTANGRIHKDVELQHIVDILLTARGGALYVEGANRALATSGKCSGRCSCPRAWS